MNKWSKFNVFIERKIILVVTVLEGFIFDFFHVALKYEATKCINKPGT